MIKGIDISEWQGQVDFDKISKATSFVIIRSSYGVGYIDKQFIRNQKELRRLGMLRGYYHYAYPQYNTPEAEADWFLQTVGEIQDGELLFLDFEEKYPDPVGWSKRFLDRVSSKLNGYKPLIYLNRFLTQSYDWKPVVSGNYGLWLAHWDYLPDSQVSPTPWSVVAMRQYSNNGSVDGTTGRIDLNVFYGDATTFKKYGVKVVSIDWKKKYEELEKKYNELVEDHKESLTHISNMVGSMKVIKKEAEKHLA